MRLLALTTTHAAAELEPADIIVPDLTRIELRVSQAASRRLELREKR
jgi:hypothetical protein